MEDRGMQTAAGRPDPPEPVSVLPTIPPPCSGSTATEIQIIQNNPWSAFRRFQGVKIQSTGNWDHSSDIFVTFPCGFELTTEPDPGGGIGWDLFELMELVDKHMKEHHLLEGWTMG